MNSTVACFIAFLLCSGKTLPSPVGGSHQVGENFAQGQPSVDSLAKDFDFGKTRLDPKDIVGLSEADLGFLRGVVFGRHGRVFKEPAIQARLAREPWYKPAASFWNGDLNDIERQNVDIIREAESNRHKYVQPGDLRFYKSRVITPKMVGDASLLDLRIMKAEIEAIHGKTFNSDPSLNEYFNERYWYEADFEYDARKALLAVDRQNIALFAMLERKKRGVRLAPCEMANHMQKAITSADTVGLGLLELRLLRNEVYARRGYRFANDWLDSYFTNRSWYKALAPKKKAKLTSVDVKNVEILLARERSIHDSLSTKPLSRETIENLSPEDLQKLRNEIPARHGLIFKDRQLREYFGSLDWYRPSKAYRASTLTKVERENMALIAEAQKVATAAVNLAEG